MPKRIHKYLDNMDGLRDEATDRVDEILAKINVDKLIDNPKQIKKLFNVYLEDDSFGLHVIQTNSSKSFSAGGGGGFNIRISIEGHGSWKQEIRNVYNLSLQLHGDNAFTWLNYINNKYENRFDQQDDNTLYLIESSDGVKLSFLNSIVDINKV